MAVLRRRRRRRRTAPAETGVPRRTVVVELPEAPGAAHRPAPLVLPVPPAGRGWALPAEPAHLRALASYLTALDLAPPGAVLDVGAGAGEFALLAAVYGNRLVRAVEADPVRAHAARQAAASNALAVIVEERRLAGPGAGPQSPDGETLDGYVERTALEPRVVRLGPGADAPCVLGGGLGLLQRSRPWVVVGSALEAVRALDRVPEMVALGYRVITETGEPAPYRGYVLAPEAVGSAFWRRLQAWSTALLTAVGSAAAPGDRAAAEVLDLRAAEGASSAT